MLVHSLLVESVDLRRLGGSAGGNDFLSDRFDRCPEAPGEKKLGPVARKGACDSTADRTSGSVDHRNFVLQHHLWFLSGPGGHTRPPHELRSTGETHLGVAAIFAIHRRPDRRTVNDTDTATSRNWAPTDRPVRPPAVVYIEMEVRQGAGERRRESGADDSRPDLKGAGRGRRRVPRG